MIKITDERLILRNLQHIRISYIVQTIGILCILGYELYKGGVEGMTRNPLWLVFMLTTIVYAYLSMSTSVEQERRNKNPKKSFIISLTVVTVIDAAISVFTAITPGFNWKNGILIGAILFICGIIPVYYIYRLRMKQEDDNEE